MNRYLYILFAPIMTSQLYGAQTDNTNIRPDIILQENRVYLFESGNICSKAPLTYKQLDARCNKLLQNRPLLEEIDSSYRQEPFLKKNYIWEKIGRPNHPNQYLCTKYKNGCARWHQIHVDNSPIEQSFPLKNTPTVEQLRTSKKQLINNSRQLRQHYENALHEEQSLLAQEVLSIVKPVAALVQINKCERQHELYLKHSQERSNDLKTTSLGLRKKIPLDIQEYLKKNPETWNSLKMLAHLEEQEAEIDQEKVCKQADYTSLKQDKLQTQEELQNAWLAFDQVAMSNTALAQQAYAQKRHRMINAHPNNPHSNATAIELTNEEIADYICTYKVKTVLANVISKEEQDILASTYPTAIPACIQGAHAQQLFLQDPELALIEAAKKILLLNVLNSKRKLLIEQDPAIIATSIQLTSEEREECLRIWNISEMLKKITTEKQLREITDRFPHYTLKIMANVSTKPKLQEDYNEQEISWSDDNQGLDQDTPSKLESAEQIQKKELAQSISSNSWMGISSFMSWGQQ